MTVVLHARIWLTPAAPHPGEQSEFGLRMHGPEALATLPCDAFRAAFVGNEEAFRCTVKGLVKGPMCSAGSCGLSGVPGWRAAVIIS